MESFIIFTSLAIGDHIFMCTTFRNKTLQNDWVRLAMASEVVQKQHLK